LVLRAHSSITVNHLNYLHAHLSTETVSFLQVSDTLTVENLEVSGDGEWDVDITGSGVFSQGYLRFKISNGVITVRHQNTLISTGAGSSSQTMPLPFTISADQPNERYISGIGGGSIFNIILKGNTIRVGNPVKLADGTTKYVGSLWPTYTSTIL
jgi:hypothetical protein